MELLGTGKCCTPYTLTPKAMIKLIVSISLSPKDVTRGVFVAVGWKRRFFTCTTYDRRPKRWSCDHIGGEGSIVLRDRTLLFEICQTRRSFRIRC